MYLHMLRLRLLKLTLPMFCEAEGVLLFCGIVVMPSLTFWASNALLVKRNFFWPLCHRLYFSATCLKVSVYSSLKILGSLAMIL